MSPPGDRDYRILGLLLAAFAVCYAPALTDDYGFRDDYRNLDAGPLSFVVRQVVQEGRPLNALGMHAALWMATEIQDLLYPRIVGIAGIALLAWSVFRALVRVGYGRLQACCVGVVTGCALPFQVYAAYASVALYPFAALLSGAAFRLGERSYDSRRPRSRWLLAAGAGLVLTAALAIFQPAAMCFWTFAAIALLRPETPARETLHRFGWCCLIAAGGMLLEFALVRLAAVAFPYGPARSGLIRDVPAKAAWFLSEPLPNALNFAWFPVSGVVSWSIAAVIAGGLSLHLRHAPGRWVKGCVALALLPLSHAPNLVVALSFAAYRTLPGLTSLIVVLAYLAFRGYARRLRLPLAAFGVNAAAGVAAIACMLSAAWRVHTFFVTPQRLELAVMRSQLTPERLAGAQGISIVRSRPEDTLAPRALYDEFGAPFSETRDVPALARLLLRETAPEHADLPVTSVGFAELAEPPPGALVVDMSNLREAAARVAPAMLR